LLLGLLSDAVNFKLLLRYPVMLPLRLVLLLRYLRRMLSWRARGKVLLVL
jgi:hypothetical protein